MGYSRRIPWAGAPASGPKASRLRVPDARRPVSRIDGLRSRQLPGRGPYLVDETLLIPDCELVHDAAPCEQCVSSGSDSRSTSPSYRRPSQQITATPGRGVEWPEGTAPAGSHRIVESDDVLVDIAPSLIVVGVLTLPHALHFEVQEESLHHRVSQQFALRLMLQTTRCRFSKAWYSSLAYWLPPNAEPVPALADAAAAPWSMPI